MVQYDFDGYSAERYVRLYYPNARIKDENFLNRVYVDVNGLSTWREIASNLTEDRAWEDAAEWVYNESYYIENKKKLKNIKQ